MMGVGICGCGAGEGPFGGPPPSLLEELHGDEITAVSVLPAFVGRGLGALEPADLWLVRGELSKSSLTRMAQRDVPTTVERARLPLFVERRDADLWLVPLARLEPETDFTIVALGAGEIARFSTNAEVLVELERAGDGSVAPGEWVAYCAEVGGDSDGPGTGADLLGRVELASWEEGAEYGCVRFRVPEDASGYWPVPSLGGAVRLSPEPLWVERAPRRECSVPSPAAPEESGGFLSLEVPPGFSVLRVRSGGSVGEAGGGDWLEARGFFATPGALHLGPLAPETDYEGTVWHLSDGCPSLSTFSIRSGPPAPRFVLTEIYADPLGPEPASEWIELRNVGSQEGNLLGFRVRDGSGEVALPNVVLPANGVGLILRPDYRAGGLDGIPDADSLAIVVPKIGGNGLSNSGEAVTLVDADGGVLSALPSLPATAGRSWSRREPWLPDVAASFVEGEPTPGY